MFYEAKRFSQDLSNWDVGNALHLQAMFFGASRFKSDLSSWMVGKVETFYQMFHSAKSFNSDTSGWNVSRGSSFSYMMFGATKFNQDLNAWGDLLFEVSYRSGTLVPVEQKSYEVFTNSGCPQQPSLLKVGMYCRHGFSVYACLETAFATLGCSCDARNASVHDLQHSDCKTKYVDAGNEAHTFDAKVSTLYSVICSPH
jgi:hypothetical protein